MADCSPASAWVLATIVALSLTCALARAHDNLVVGVCEDGAQASDPLDMPASP